MQLHPPSRLQTGGRPEEHSVRNLALDAQCLLNAAMRQVLCLKVCSVVCAAGGQADNNLGGVNLGDLSDR